MKEHSKTSELRVEEIANLPDGEFKALVIKMLTELIRLGLKIKEQIKDTQKQINQNIQGTNSDRKETMIQSNNLEQKKEINIQPEQKEETRIQKNREAEDSLGQPETFQYTNYMGARRRRTTARN